MTIDELIRSVGYNPLAEYTKEEIIEALAQAIIYANK